MTDQYTQPIEDSIAIIGIAGRFPGAKNTSEFWQNLRDGVNSIVYFSGEEAVASGLDPAFLDNPQFVRAYGVLDDIDKFDAAFFNMSPREARILDPQHRIFLECSYEVLEDAGYDSETYEGRIGVYAGAGMSTYLLRNLLPSGIFQFVTAERLEMAITNQKDLMPMRVSFELNLTGPSVNISTTCSTSLVATHMACQALLTYQCDMIVTGGSFVRVPQTEGYLYQEGTVYSPDGQIRAFDSEAKGIVIGSGAGVMLLKRLEDAIDDGDHIYAIIRGSAVNNDGATKLGYTAPSADGQAEATAQAIDISSVPSETITYVEAHGTGTFLGDPIEFASLLKAFKATAADPDNQPKNYCAVGSVKTNIGHTNHAAGITGLMKTVLSLHHKILPPSLNFKTPNPKLDFANSPFFVNTELRAWETPGTMPRRALVNSFGIGGTNAHVVVEEAPAPIQTTESRPWQLITLSAKTETALDTMTTNLINHLKQNPELDLADVAYTLAVGRRALKYRRTVACESIPDTIEALEKMSRKRVSSGSPVAEMPAVVFMFSGQGAQYINMARDLYQHEPTFQEYVDTCADLLKPHLDLDLRTLLYPEESDADAAAEQLQQTRVTQPALFVIEYALAQLWMSWGIEPKAMVGHSIGEYVAACLAGVFSLEDALALVAARGQLMQSMPSGSMLAVSLPAADLEPLLGEGLSIAVINSHTMTVAAGEDAAIEALQVQLKEKGIDSTPLHTSHAFHSAMMQPIVEPFTQRVAATTMNAPQIPYLSNVTGTWITAEEATDPAYWASHLRNTVRFADNMGHLVQDPTQILLEVGPGRTLATLAKQHPDYNREQVVLTSTRHIKDKLLSDVSVALGTLGKLWTAGVKVSWAGLYADEQRQRVSLPTYPFERKYYWVAAPPRDATGKPTMTWDDLDKDDPAKPTFEAGADDGSPRNAEEAKIAQIWQEVLHIDQIGIHADFFELGGSSLIAIGLAAKLRERLNTELSVQEFLNAPTIAELAALIDPGSTSTQDTNGTATPTKPSLPPSLVKIKNGTGTPLFMVHPIDGHVFIYRTLAQSLSTNRPVYAFQAPGIEGETEPITQIEAMASYYINTLKAVQPAGPYLLGGFSFGGMVAFEMAQQLQAQAQTVDMLFLIDTPPVGQSMFNHEDNASLLSFIADNLLQLNGNAMSTSELQGLSFQEQLGQIAERTKHGQLVGLETVQLQHIVNIVKVNNQAMLNYTPQPYAGRLLYFRAQEPWHEGANGQAEYFWMHLANGGVEIMPIPGNHFTMNQDPNVQTIAKRLDISLKQVELGLW